MPTRVRLAELTLADLRRTVQTGHTEQRVPDIGARLASDIVVSIDRLTDHSGMGRVVPEFNRPPFGIV